MENRKDNSGIPDSAIAWGLVILFFVGLMLYALIKPWVTDGKTPTFMLGAIFGPVGFFVAGWLIQSARKIK